MKEKSINFHNNKMWKYGSQYICLSVILIDFVFKMGKNYYPQECKYIVKEKQMTRHITEELKISFNESNKSNEEQFSFNKHLKRFTGMKNLQSVNFFLPYTILQAIPQTKHKPIQAFLHSLPNTSTKKTLTTKKNAFSQ